MFKKIGRTFLITSIAGLTVLGVSACSSVEKSEPVKVAENAELNQAPDSIGISVNNLTNEPSPSLGIKKNSEVHITGINAADMGNWTGTSSNEEIATFSSSEGFIGFKTKNTGTADVTLTNSATGETYKMVIKVSDTDKVQPLDMPVSYLSKVQRANFLSPPNSALNITGINAADMGNWTGTSSNEEAVVFLPGNPDDPNSVMSFKTKAFGESYVTLTNNVTGESYSFKMVVE